MSEEVLKCRYCGTTKSKYGPFKFKAALAQHEVNWCPKNPNATLRKKA